MRRGVALVHEVWGSGMVWLVMNYKVVRFTQRNPVTPRKLDRVLFLELQSRNGAAGIDNIISVMLSTRMLQNAKLVVAVSILQYLVETGYIPKKTFNPPHGWRVFLY